jgi:hypothetical protein
MPDHDDILTEVFTAVADDIENRVYTNWVAGPQVWRTVSAVMWELFATPATEAIARKVGVAQPQQWDTDQATAVKVLRELAGSHEQLDLLREQTTEHKIMQARRVLADAVGWPAEDRASLTSIARETARDMNRLRVENDRLRAELAAERRRNTNL